MPVFLLFLGICATIATLAPELTMVIGMTIIGLPVALVLVVAPFLFLFCLLWVFLNDVLKLLPMQLPKVVAVSLSLGLTLVPFVVPALFANIAADRQVSEYLALDSSEFQRPEGARTIAEQRLDNGANRGCDGFCLHALLSGEIDRFIRVGVSSFHDIGSPFDPNLPGEAYFFEHREECPPTEFTSSYGLEVLSWTPQQRSGRYAVTLAEERLLDGLCLVSEPATALEADLIIHENWLVRNDDNDARFRFNPFASPVSAYYRRIFINQNGTLTEAYRRTALQVDRLPFIAVPMPLWNAGGGSYRASFGLLRTEQFVNSDSRSRAALGWASFLTETLGYNLDLSDGGEGSFQSIRAEQAARGEQIATQVGGHTDQQLQFLESFVKTRLAYRQSTTLEEQVAIISILENQTLPLPQEFGFQEGWALLDQLEPELNARFADAVMGRLYDVAFKATPGDRSTIEGYRYSDEKEQLGVLGSLVGGMSAAIEERHWDRLATLSENAILNAPAAEIMATFKRFGERGFEQYRSVLQQIIGWSEMAAGEQPAMGLGYGDGRAASIQLLGVLRRELCERGTDAESLIPLLVEAVRVVPGSVAFTERTDWVRAFALMGMESDELFEFISEKYNAERRSSSSPQISREWFDDALRSVNRNGSERCD